MQELWENLNIVIHAKMQTNAWSRLNGLQINEFPLYNKTDNENILNQEVGSSSSGKYTTS